MTKCNTDELLIRIDERVKSLPKIKEDLSIIKSKISDHDTRITIIEREHEKPMHNGGTGWFLKLILKLVGR